MNQSFVLLVGIASIAVVLAAIGIFNQTHAQNTTTMPNGNMTGGNATMTMGNTTGGNETSLGNATGTISSRGH